MDYRTFIADQLQQAARTALQYFGHTTSTIKPGDKSQVLTEADLAIGQQLIAAVQTTFPDHNIIDEEAGVIDKGSRYTWVIDPIDGTSNFAVGLPDYGILLGLLDNDSPVAGGAILPAGKKLYLAAKGKGATCNGQSIHATSETKLQNILLAFGVDANPGDPQRTIEDCRVLADLIEATINFRNSGSEPIDTLRIAEGRYGGRVNLSSKIWDNVAPQIIAEEAGALYTTVNGQPLKYPDPLRLTGQNFRVCIAPPVLHHRMQTIIAGRLA